MITLATLSQATAQQVFDQVKTHLLTQMQKAEGPKGCRYRYNGLKCAAGILIADKEYHEDMDTNYGSWESLVVNKIVPSAHQELIKDLQTVHDEFKTDSWESKLKEIAHTFNLKYE